MIEYAGVPLLMEDPEGVLRDFLARFLPTAETTLFGRPVAWGDTTPVFTSPGADFRVGFPVPNYPAPPPLRLNSLYWPTGAARWSRMLCLATEEAKDAIVAKVRTGTRFTEVSAAQLVLGPSDYAEGQQFGGNIEANGWSRDESGRVALSTAMYLLPPRPVSDAVLGTDDGTGPGSVGRLWLLPLVDERWFWQWKHSITLGETDGYDPELPWSTGYVAGIGQALGITLATSDPIAAEYEAIPNTAQGIDYLPAAVVADAVAHSLAMRFVRDIDGACRLEGAQSAFGRLSLNRDGADHLPWDLAAGGDGDARMVTIQTPQSVLVAFDSGGGTPGLHASLTVTHLAADFGIEDYQSGVVKTFRIATAAVFRPMVDGQFALSTAETDLAARVAEDFYDWRHVPHDRTFAGLKRWSLGGLDDHVEWTWGRLGPDGEYIAQTRAQGVPLNFGVDELIFYDAEPVDDTCPWSGKVVPFEAKATLDELSNGVEAWMLVAAEGDGAADPNGLARDPVTVYGRLPSAAYYFAAGGFRGQAFGADDVTSGDAQGDVFWATQIRIRVEPEEGDPYWECRWYAVSGGRQTIRGTIDVEGGSGSVADGAEGYLLVTDDNPGTGIAGFDARVFRVPVTFEVRGNHGDARSAEWDSSKQRWYARNTAGTVPTLFEVTEDLTEGDDDGAAAYVLDAGGARSGSLITIYPSPYSDLPAPAQVGKVGPFRGVAFSAQGSTPGLRGDVVHAIYHEGQWIALGSGRTAGSGVATEVGRPGSDITVALNENDNREITVVARCLCTIPADAIVQVVWNGLMRRWDATSPCRPDDDDELPDPGDPEDPPGSGGGGGPGGGSGPCGCGLPPGVECSPLDCCPEDDTGLTVTDCEEFATAPEEYYVEVPSLTCVPDCATGNEPDETSGLPPGRVTLTYAAGYTCVWESDVFDCGDGVEWQWQLIPSLDGRSWLRLYKDAVVFLSWQTNDAWCPRCDNPVTIYCPPDECTDLTEKLCVKPVCGNCADGICYTVDNPSDWDGVVSDGFTWPPEATNSGAGITDADEGRPTPPSRKISFVIGTVPDTSDFALVAETFPGIGFDPATCAVDLDGVCGIELSVKVQVDDSVSGLGVQFGIAIKQGGNVYVAPIGDARLGDGWVVIAVNRLLATNFWEVTSTGLDDASNPDWTAATGTAMTFGVALWAGDHAVDDRAGGPLNIVANWDILRLCLDSEPCTGDPASYLCPDGVAIVACEEADATTARNVAFTNDGDSPFTLVSVGGAGALETACGRTVTVDTDGFLGPLAPGETRNITITVDRTTPIDCAGTLTITTNLPGEAAVCVVPVTIVVLAEDECEPGSVCVGELNENFDDDGLYDLMLLADDDYEIETVNTFGLSWGGPYPKMLNLVSGAAEDVSEDYDGLQIVSGVAQPRWGGLVGGASNGLWPGAKVFFEELEDFSGGFGTSWMLRAHLFRHPSAIATIGVYLFDDVRNYLGIRRINSHDVQIVRAIDGVETQEEITPSGFASAGGEVIICVWRVGPSIKVAVMQPPGGGIDNNDVWADPVGLGGGYVFDEVIVNAALGKLAIGLHAGGESATDWPQVYAGHLCCTTQQGTAPPWEV